MEMTNVLYGILNVLCYLPKSNVIVMLADNLTFSAFLYPDNQSSIYFCCFDCTPFRAMSVLTLGRSCTRLDSAKLPDTVHFPPRHMGGGFFPTLTNHIPGPKDILGRRVLEWVSNLTRIDPSVLRIHGLWSKLRSCFWCFGGTSTFQSQPYRRGISRRHPELLSPIDQTWPTASPLSIIWM
jgi:hypothetical protein